MAPRPSPVFFDELFESDVIFGGLWAHFFWHRHLLKFSKNPIFFEQKIFQKVFGRHFHWVLTKNSYKIDPESSKKDAFSGTTYMGVHLTPTPLRSLDIIFPKFFEKMGFKKFLATISTGMLLSF